MFVNCSNHPSIKWSKKQKEAGEKLGFGPIVDVGFPQVPPTADGLDIQELATKLANKIISHNAKGVFIAGEFTLTFATINWLMISDIPCYAACSERIVKETTDEKGHTHKNVIFEFVQWRKFVK
jgi:hypothetical protein